MLSGQQCGVLWTRMYSTDIAQDEQRHHVNHSACNCRVKSLTDCPNVQLFTLTASSSVHFAFSAPHAGPFIHSTRGKPAASDADICPLKGCPSFINSEQSFKRARKFIAVELRRRRSPRSVWASLGCRGLTPSLQKVIATCRIRTCTLNGSHFATDSRRQWTENEL